jgi:endonuclease/exonuclease/phosphatase (EEP) superfamily protein YafD
VLALFLLLRTLIGEAWPIIALFNSFAHLLLIPALFLLPLALLLRRRWTSGLLVPAVLTFALGYGPTFLPRTAQAAPDAAQLSLLTYNLHGAGANFEPRLSIMRESGADIIALQELSSEMAAALETELLDLYPYQAHHTAPGRSVLGQGVLSRYPLTSDDYWIINLAHQRVQFEFQGQTLTLYNEHPTQPMKPFGFIQRRAEIDDLLERTANETGPLLLAGDFNMSDLSADYGRIASRYNDAYRAAGWGLGFTFPAALPYIQRWPALARLDYVFHDEHFKAVEARVWPHAGGSDHMPVFVTLQLRS